MKQSTLRVSRRLRASATFLLAGALAFGAAVGCGSNATGLSEAEWSDVTLSVAGPWVHALHPTRGGVYVFDATTAGVDVRSVQTEGTPLVVEGTDDDLWILTSNPSRLERVRVRTGERTGWPLPAAYGRLAVREDGRWATVWYGSSSVAGSDEILYNANQVSIVDTESRGEPAVRTVGMQGIRPERFVFPMPLPLADGPVDYATVAGPQGLAFLRLAPSDAENEQRVVPLGFSATDTSNRPSELHFVQDDEASNTICVASAQNSDLLFAVELAAGDPSSARELQPTVNVLTMPGVVQGVYPFRRDGEARLLVTTRSQRIAVVDPITGTVTPIAVDAPIASAVVWTDESAGTTRNRALLIPSQGAWVALVELDVLEIEGATSLRVRRVGQPVASAERIAGTPTTRALLRYANGGGIGLLDLDRGTETTIPARVSLSEAILTSAAIVAGVPSEARLALVDVDTAVASTVDLVAPGLELLTIPERDVLVVTHERRVGWYTFLSSERPSDAPIAELRGVFLDQLLDDGAER